MPILPLIFWSSTILSVCLSIAGVVARKPWLLVTGAVLAGPLAFYLGATPRFRTWAFFLPVLQVVAAGIVRRSFVYAAALLIPLVSFTVWLAVVVVRLNVGAT
jgi:hypothetical protein